METYLIVGLGNPDRKYENTRHNSGFAAIDALAGKLGSVISEQKFSGKVATVYRDGKKLLLLKPMTYMNLSGESVMAAAAYYDIPPERIIVLYDDINLAPGRLRVRGGGSAGGHNGMKSIIALLESEAFPRVRIGVGLNEVTGPDGEKIRTNLAEHVLKKLSPEERKEMEAVYERAALAALELTKAPVEEVMNHFNG